MIATKYRTITHLNPRRRWKERGAFMKYIVSIQIVRDGQRPVDVKRMERARKRAAKLNPATT